MYIVWTEKDGGRYFQDEEAAVQYAKQTGGRVEEVTEVGPDQWWKIR